MPCPPEFIAAGAIVVAGSVIGARCAAKPKPKDDWLIVPNIWGANVGVPSEKKSPAANVAMQPLDRLIARAIEKHARDLKQFEAQNVVFAVEKEALEYNIKVKARAKYSTTSKSSNGSNGSTVEGLVEELKKLQEKSPRQPIQRRYKTNDCTIEKLGELLAITLTVCWCNGMKSLGFCLPGIVKIAKGIVRFFSRLGMATPASTLTESAAVPSSFLICVSQSSVVSNLTNLPVILSKPRTRLPTTVCSSDFKSWFIQIIYHGRGVTVTQQSPPGKAPLRYSVR
jgi:hypothetical protein